MTPELRYHCLRLALEWYGGPQSADLNDVVHAASWLCHFLETGDDLSGDPTKCYRHNEDAAA